MERVSRCVADASHEGASDAFDPSQGMMAILRAAGALRWVTAADGQWHEEPTGRDLAAIGFDGVSRRRFEACTRLEAEFRGQPHHSKT